MNQAPIMEWAFSETTPRKPVAFAAAEIITPDRSDTFRRIRTDRKLSLAGSDLLDLDRTDEKKSGESSTTLLPEKYEILCGLFIAMVYSVRLLRLRRTPTTFTKLCHTISSYANKRFTLHCLAQLKHVIPEVVMVEKIRVLNKETLCMKEELLVTLNTDAKGSVGFAHLERMCRSRITDYFANHPEGDDIPEGEIPQLFYKPKTGHELSLDNSLTDLVSVSHIAPSFKPRFASRALSGSIPEDSSPKLSSCLPEIPIKEAICTKTEDGASDIIAELKGTLAKLASAPELKGTPAKLASTPERLMSTTPALRPPKPALMTPDRDLPNKSVRLSLNFDTSGGDFEDQSIEKADDELNVQSSIACVQSLVEKEGTTLEEQDHILSQASRRERLIAGVSKLPNMIRLLFQSIGRPTVTKQELIYKIVEGDLDIVDRREVEERLDLLLELAPEFISEKSCLSGDIVLQLNKLSSPELIRAKLLEIEAK